VTKQVRRFRKFSFIFLLFVLASPAFAQQKSGYSLLWKISGKGMARPSYLFGTMHVKDKRVFNFSDSVMLALQNCRQFSLEVHPDTLMAKMFATLQNPDSLRSIDKLLGKDDYEKLAKKFKDKNGYEMGKTDPMLLESLMESPENKPDDKVSFVDAYLYGIARTLNKNILGLEDAGSQIDQYFGSREAIKERLLDLLDDDYTGAAKDGLEEVVNVYSTGNIDEIYKYIIDGGGGQDSTIIARNKVMASSITKYMADGPLFSAVGAAHLPGPNGVIALLQKEGYTVTPVGATFTGVADKYHIDYMKMNWPVYRDESQGYAVNFPGVPIRFKMSGLNTIIYPDLANEVYYGVYAVPRGFAGAPPNRAQVIKRFIDNVKQSAKNNFISRRDFIYNKMPCTELTLKSGPTYSRLRLVVENNTLFAFYAGARLDKLNQPHINRYLNSFKIIPVIAKAPASWITYSNPVAGFTVKMPGEPKAISQDVPTVMDGHDVKFRINMYVSTDSVSSKSYLVRYNDYPNGSFLNNGSSIFDEIEKQFEGKGKIIGEPVKITIDGHEAREMSVVLNGGFHAKLRLFARGNRVYMLFKEVTQPDMKDDGKDVFFESFKLTPYVAPEYYTFRSDSGDFEVKMPAKPDTKTDSTRDLAYTDYLKNNHTYYATDPNSGGMYVLEHTTVSPYYRAKNVDSLYQDITNNITGYRDSLVRVDTITVNGIKGRDLLTQRRGNGFKKRSRLIIKGDDVFIFTTYTDESELFGKTAETLYGSLKVDGVSSKTNISASKAELIFRDLSSPDSIIFKNAKGALSYYKFTADELPGIYSALQKNYPDDTTRGGVRMELIRRLTSLHNDTTAKFLSKLYHDLKDKDDLKAVILNDITQIDTVSGYNTYLSLLTSADVPLKAKNIYEVFRPLSDSVEMAAVHFQQLLPFMKYINYRSHVLGIAHSLMLKKDAGFNKLVNDNYNALMAYAKDDLDSYLALPDTSRYASSVPLYYYMLLMGEVNGHELNNQLTKTYLEKDANGAYVPAAINARIANGLPNNPAIVKKLLDSVSTRYDIMEAFNKQNQLNRVPLKYRQQVEFAKLCLYQVVSMDDYGTPDKVTLLGTIVKNGSTYYAFKFKLTDYDDKHEMIGLAGPYKAGSAKLNFGHYYVYTTYAIVKTNWRAQATEMIKPLNDANKQ